MPNFVYISSRDFLSPKYKFMQTEISTQAFNESNEIKTDLIRSCVQMFYLGKLTCFGPDRSTQGLGCFLMQKHCECNSLLLDCCTTGWKVTLAGSRFLNGAEKYYIDIERDRLPLFSRQNRLRINCWLQKSYGS